MAKRKGRYGKLRSKDEKVIDNHVGSQLLRLRVLSRISQYELAEKVDLTFQQIQKYENGANRIGASRLWQFAMFFQVEPNYFFEGLDGLEEIAIEQQELPTELVVKKESHELLRNYYNMDSKARAGLYQLIKSMAV